MLLARDQYVYMMVMIMSGIGFGDILHISVVVIPTSSNKDAQSNFTEIISEKNYFLSLRGS